MSERKTIDLEQGWDFMLKGIQKLKNILEGLPEPQFSSEDYMMLYTTIYNMCTQKPPNDYSQPLYDKYREAFEEYILSTVLPSLREKHDEFMLRELVRRWANHKIMVRWLSRFFHYLDRYFIARRSLPPLNEVGLTCFRDLVYKEVNGKVRDAVISLIDQEREGEQIDRALIKNVLDIFVEIGMGHMDHYENDFETAMLKDTSAYYSRKASNWILEDSCPDYMLKAEECLKREKDRVANYLHSSSEPKLLEKVQHELLSVYANQLLEKEHSGCHALLRDDKVEDLSRMFRLFSKIPKGLDPVSSIFKQHVTEEGTTLVKLAEDAASNKKPHTHTHTRESSYHSIPFALSLSLSRVSSLTEEKAMDSGFVNSLPKLTDDELNQQIQTKQMEVATEPDNVDFAAALELLNTELGKRDTIRNSPLALSINGYNDREIQERISSLQETLTKIKGPISDGGGKLQASIELLEREVEKRKIDKELSVFKNSKEVCDEFNKLFYIDLKERIKNMKSLLAKLPPSDNRGDDLRAAINLAEDIRSTRKKQLQQSRRRSLELEREQRRRQNPPQYAINTHPGRAIPDCRIFTNLKPQVRWTYMNLTAEFKGVVRSMIGEKDAAKLETLKGQAQDVFVKIRKICFGDPELWIDLFEKSESYEILSRVDDSTLKENQDFSFCTVCNKNEMLYNVVVTNCHHPLCLKCYVSACKEMRPCSQCNTTITAEGSRTAHDTKTKHEEVMEILLTKENDKKVVVFSEFSAPLHKLKASLESSNIKAWICIKGKELEGTNSKLIQEFKDSTKGVLLVSLDLLDFLKSQELASAEEWKVIIMSRLPNTLEEKALFVVYESERTEEMVYYVTASDTFEGSFSINDIGAEGKLSGGEGLDDEDRGILKFSAEDCKKLLKGIDHMVGSQPSVSP